MALAALSLVVAASAPAFPASIQSDEEPEPQTEGEAAVETILREQEQLARGQRFAYEPAGRRDPFQSLFETMPGAKGKRPKGVEGMLINEIDLAGVVQDTRDGDVAMVIGSDNKGYFLRVGDAVYDGTVIAVDPRLGAVTFRQQVDDPRRIKPYRDVVKRLVPVEESADE
ncbi:MAG: hypothetical protein GY716_14055 [bacterium]|nr:hypothetical protein [bacterium]